jgi:hypothetical protein
VTSTVDSDVKPAPFLHCETVYKAMRETATEVHESEVPMLVWEGFLTKLMLNLNLSVPYYSTVKNYLTKMGCIRQLKRGGGTTPSQWELIKPPTPALWDALPEKPANRPGPVSGTDPSEVAMLKQRLSNLAERQDKLEEGQELLVELYNKMIKEKKS